MLLATTITAGVVALLPTNVPGPTGGPVVGGATASAPGPPKVPAVAYPAGSIPPAAPDRQTLRQMLSDAAARQGIDPGLVMAVAWWESGWDQSRVSSTGALGIMQVDPVTAASAGPSLLRRPADPNLAADNVQLGAAILKEDLDRYGGDVGKALLAYYAGPPAVAGWPRLDANAQAYVTGVAELASAFDQNRGPV